MPGRLVFSTTADGASTPTARMLVNSAGNVGIGTTSPTAKLDVAGSVNIAGTLAITSNTLVTNLNSDLLDGQSGSYYLNAGNLTGTINTSVLVAGTPSQNELLTYNETANSWANTLPQDNNNLIAMSMIF
jgi:hypothetical protein